MTRAIKFPELPELPADLDPSLREWAQVVEQQLNLMRGNIAAGTNTRFVTIQDLVDAAVIADGDIT